MEHRFALALHSVLNVPSRASFQFNLATMDNHGKSVMARFVGASSFLCYIYTIIGRTDVRWAESHIRSCYHVCFELGGNKILNKLLPYEKISNYLEMHCLLKY